MPVDPVFLVAAVTIFVATNIDNSVVLVTFFGHDGYHLTFAVILGEPRHGHRRPAARDGW